LSDPDKKFTLLCCDLTMADVSDMLEINMNNKSNRNPKTLRQTVSIRPKKRMVD